MDIIVYITKYPNTTYQMQVVERIDTGYTSEYRTLLDWYPKHPTSWRKLRSILKSGFDLSLPLVKNVSWRKLTEWDYVTAITYFD